MSDPVKGILAMVIACTIWGLSPLFYGLLRHVPPLEVLSYRSLWSLVFFALVLTLQGRLRLVWDALSRRSDLLWIAIAGTVIASNWFGYIYAISIGNGVDASLGYYIFPLVAVGLGRVFLKEALGTWQWLAIALAALAVLILTIGLGVAPWIALHLAISFGIYGIVKKRLTLGPVVSVTAEVVLLAPLALIWIGGWGTGVGGGNNLGTHALLALSGPLTAWPLVLFSYAAKRVRLSTIGLVQYLSPTLQFACATLVFGELITPWHQIAFPMIWVALAVYSGASILQDRAARRSD